MKSVEIFDQIVEVVSRSIASGLAVRQFHPSIKEIANGGKLVGALKNSSSVALKNIAYKDIYRELEQNDLYHIKLIDGGLLTFQYTFDAEDNLVKHRLVFFPPSELPTAEEAPLLYEHDELYGDIILKMIVRFPIRIDFDPRSARDVSHPHSHITFGQFENCRIPVSHPVIPNTFLLFILRNFYYRFYLRNKNAFDKKTKFVAVKQTISNEERRIPHLVVAPFQNN